MRRYLQAGVVVAAVMLFMGAGDDMARFNSIGHRMMCMCSCNQILLECNHVGCTYSDRMRAELIEAVDRGDSDDLTIQAFVQKYGPTVMAAPSATGFNKVAWIMPYVALVLGVITVVVVVRTWKMRPTPPLADGVKPVSGAVLERFREQARKETEL